MGTPCSSDSTAVRRRALPDAARKRYDSGEEHKEGDKMTTNADRTMEAYRNDMVAALSALMPTWRMPYW